MTQRRDSKDLVILAALLGALFGLGGLGSSAMAVVLPQAAAELGVSLPTATWMISLYALALAVSTPIYGRLIDSFGVRIPMLLGVGLMATGALVVAGTHDFGVALAARVLQGLGSGVGGTLAVTVVSQRYEGADRVRGLSISAALMAVIGTGGPIFGGLATELASWRLAAALPSLALLMVVLVWPRVGGRGSPAGFDVLGMVLVSLAAGGLILILQSPSSGLIFAVVGLGMAVVCTPLVVRRGRRLSTSFLPGEVLLNAPLLRACLITAVIPAAWFGVLVAVPAQLSSLGWAPLQIGALLLPGAGVALFAPYFAPRVRARLDGTLPLVAASALISCSLGLVVVAGHTPVGVSAVLLGLAVALVSACFAVAQSTLFDIVGDLTHVSIRGIASGFATFVLLVGGSVGSAVVGGLSAYVQPTDTLAVLLVVSAVAAGAGYVYRDPRVLHKRSN